MYLETAVSSEETGVEVAMKKVVAVVETLTVARAKDSDREGGPVVCMKETRSMTFEVECGAFHKVPMSRWQTGLLGEEVHEIEVLVLGPEVEVDVLEFVTGIDRAAMQECPE